MKFSGSVGIYNFYRPRFLQRKLIEHKQGDSESLHKPQTAISQNHHVDTNGCW